MKTESMTWTHEQLMKINSMTKYPSIETYHPINHIGMLDESCPMIMGEPDDMVSVYEKIDGANSRIVILPGEIDSHSDILIGSREELLHYETDVLWRQEYGIVPTLRKLVMDEDMHHARNTSNKIIVLYLETYGHPAHRKVAKNYSSDGTLGSRLFDIIEIEYDQWSNMLSWDLDQIAIWRNNGNQDFYAVDEFEAEAKILGIKTVPHVARLRAEEMPTDIEGCFEWMSRLLPETYAALDEKADKKPEGIVIRNYDRSRIAKLRFQNYLRTMDLMEKSSGEN